MKKEVGIVIGVLVVVLLGAYFLNRPAASSTKYDAFAICIKDSGATFYGAFWCPHCKAQKAMFGDSVKYLPYVECSEPDGQTQTPICIQKGIQSYPTWVFANGTREEGTLELSELSKQTSCPLPAGDVATSTDVGNATSVKPQTGTAVIGASTTVNVGVPNGKL